MARQGWLRRVCRLEERALELDRPGVLGLVHERLALLTDEEVGQVLYPDVLDPERERRPDPEAWVAVTRRVGVDEDLLARALGVRTGSRTAPDERIEELIRPLIGRAGAGYAAVLRLRGGSEKATEKGAKG